MGFFSSRKHDDDSDQDKSVAQVIRSRFYGKHRTKDVKPSSPGPSYLHPSTADSDRHSTYASSANTSYGGSYTNSISSRHALRDATSIPNFTAMPTPVTPAKRVLQKPTPNTLPKASKPTASVHSRTDTSPGAGSSSKNPKRNSAIHAPGARTSTDAVTMTLAQRLNELAVANAEGLLNDDEYRLLRQNLFERFATNSEAPSEAPVVPVLGPNHARQSMAASASHNFHVSRSPSVRSKASIGSSVTSLFRRATNTISNRQSIDTHGTDTASVMSSATNRSGSLLRKTGIAKATSAGSLREHHTRQSFSSDAYMTPQKRMRSGSKRTPPPSAFTPTATTPRGVKVSTNGLLDDDDHLKTSKEIQEEISAVEAEGRRLLDAFNGLELTTLTRKTHKTRLVAKLDGGGGTESLRRSGSGPTKSGLAPDGKRREGDSLSMRSGTSAASSMYNGASPTQSTHSRSRPALVTKPVSLRRKISLTSISSRNQQQHHPSSGLVIPQVPLLSPLGRLNADSEGSSTSLGLPQSLSGGRSTGHLPLDSVFESEASTTYSEPTTGNNDGELQALEAEMADIRKRRAEVTARYETRLEYLRAKLKGAELHEKLMRN